MVASLHSHDTILVVDDNQVARKALVRLLREAGFVVLEAARGRDALCLVAEQLDLVVLDVILPDIDGFEVCRRMKAEPQTAAVPVLMVSGVAIACGDRVHGFDAGADAYLPKPVEPDELLAHARALLRVRHAEEAVRRSEEHYRALAESVPLMVWVAAPDGSIEYVNRRWREFTGLPPDDAMGRGWQRAVHPDDLSATLDRWVHSLRTTKPFEAEYRLRRADGVYRWQVGRAEALCDRAQTATRWFGTCTDIDDHRRLEQQFLQAQKLEAVGRLAGGVAHDFNNLLTIINGYAALLLSGQQAESAADMAREILAAGERGAALVRQLLAFARQQVVAPQALDLNAIVDGLGKMLRRVVGEGVELVAILQPGLGAIRADPVQMEQVILNLAINARDAMPQGGTLTIETRDVIVDNANPAAGGDDRPIPHVLLRVTDTGSGMTADVKKRIFEPFFTTKDVGKGTGLGLATVYDIVHQAGGRITVDSNLGRGSVFGIYLPATADVVKPASNPGATAPPRGKETVLLVEDDEAVRALAAGILRDCGYAVLEAGSGQEALEVCGRPQTTIDVVVADVVMPGMGGSELAERLVAARPGLQVLFLSGYTDAVVRHGLREHDVNFLQKPFTAGELGRKVRKVLDAVGPN